MMSLYKAWELGAHKYKEHGRFQIHKENFAVEYTFNLCKVCDTLKSILSVDITSGAYKSLAQHDDRRPDGLSLMPWSNDGRCLT